jgi:hypothetical protein
MTAATAKVCTKCNLPKSLECFGVEKLGLYGRKSACRVCIQEIKKTKRGQYTSYESKRRVKGKVALTPIEQEAVKAIYKAAQDLRDKGVDVAVDHIDPVNGLLVCGFTHPSNLCILTKEANLKKGNRFTPYRVEYHPDGTTTVYQLMPA